MKSIRYISIIFATLALSLLQACVHDAADEPARGDSDCISLNVSVPLTSSRAESDELNEFTVKQLHLYFFKKEGHTDAASVSLYNVTMDNEFEYSRHLIISLPGNALKDGGLFGQSSDECYVYAVANIKKPDVALTTVDNLKSTVVDSDFDNTVIQDSFAMDGFSVLSLDREKRIVSGEISLQRSAAKLTLSVDLPQSIDVEEKIVNPFDGSVQIVNTTYRSRAEEMHVWISNGVMQSKLNTESEPADESALYSNEIYATDGVGSAFTFDSTQPKYSYIQKIPFYSYPNKWDPFSPKGNCFLTLEIPWYYKDDNGKTQNVVTYYRLSVQPDKNYIERNMHYDMRVTIGRIGGTSVQQPVDMIFDWNYSMEWNIQTLPTDIKEIRYLLLNNNNFSSMLDAYYYEMDNETYISVPFNTSHPVEIESVELSWHDYKNDYDRKLILTNDGRYPYSDCSEYDSMSDYAGIELDATNSKLNLKRDILHIFWNTRSNGPEIKNETAINAYTFRIKLRHVNAEASDPSAHATVVITQIPAIYISSQTTASGTRFINNMNTVYEKRTQTGGSWWNPTYTYEYKGYLTTNNNYPSNEQQRRYYLGSYHENSSGYVKNKHTYILTISKFAAGDNYIIADPRSRDIDNLNESGTSASGDADWSMKDDSRLMKYYYPADRNPNKTRFIAPQLRVASQWGVTYDVSRRGAERRCASYQEDGRPAGRWRLPTAAEIEYICQLSSKQYIPYLFGTEGETANYWCASGGIDVDNDVSNPTVDIVSTNDYERRAVRCVYDEWFWTTDTLRTKNKFTWGDKRRSVSGNK